MTDETRSAASPCDADQHYYEVEESFTRHLEKRFRRRGIRFVSAGRRTEVVAGDRIHRFIPNPTFDPVIEPGCLDLFFRGQLPDGVDPGSIYKLEPIRAEYRDRDARVAKLEQQGLEAALMFPTMGVGAEEALREDVPAMMATIRAFNRWLEEDWGFAYKNKIFSVPLIALSDPEEAAREVEWCVSQGARMLHVRPAPVPTAHGYRSPGDAIFDPVWARIDEAAIPVAMHLGDSGYQRLNALWGEAADFEPFSSKPMDLGSIVSGTRAIHDMVAKLVMDGVFHRFPNLRVVSVENGSDWLMILEKRLRKKANQSPHLFAEHPTDTIRSRVFTTPYAEDDIPALAERIGATNVLFGSDWPHGEGLAEPCSFRDLLTELPAAETDRIMRGNLADLIGL
ncbi:MAG: amidohydrolase family protein [Deltaproteobacteria bacterium]|jgi:predicted TIM-barrel fold metal-dependent hydrolase|nr:amidohydrolase family protein [Deltaproteobacteria bacterium]MBW2499518.1 amidohydrolase family protein [Deltaproteobacteria bacterium]